MNKLLTILIPGMFALSAYAQTPSTAPTTQSFGKIDNADLEMTVCDFEKDANAEVLFDKGSVSFGNDYALNLDRHVRIKIFNDNGKDEANIRIVYFGGDRSEMMSGVQAQTINLTNGTVEITKIDKKLIYTQKVDKFRTALVFSFPDVKPGSVIEYKYSLTSENIGNFPDWYFQSHIPTRYSELSTSIPSILYYKSLQMVKQPFVKNTEDIKAIANIPSLHNEPYMSSRRDNEDRILYQLMSINGGAGVVFEDTWKKVGEDEVNYDDFGGQFKRKIKGEEDILIKAKSLSTDAAKIAYIFGEVKTNMKWDDEDVRYTNEGTAEAWDKKIGNSTEINLILYHLLKKAGINALPMLVSTRSNGKVNPAYPSRFVFNRTVAYVPVDSTNFYVLDATSKYNIYTEIPASLLNSLGFAIDKDNKKYDLIFIQKPNPAREVILINADIKPDGKMSGTTQISSFSYNRINYIKKYKTDGEEKFIKALRNDDNNLKINSLKFDNMEVDSLPLVQNIDFNLDLSGADENYIYFKPNLFSDAYRNDFLSETRSTDIDFGYLSNDVLNGIYKIPPGYKIDALPKSVSMAMSDNSVIFKRMVAQQEGSIVVRYSLNFKKSIYFKESYPEFHEFFKKLTELMDEQIVLKKG